MVIVFVKTVYLIVCSILRSIEKRKCVKNVSYKIFTKRNNLVLDPLMGNHSVREQRTMLPEQIAHFFSKSKHFCHFWFHYNQNCFGKYVGAKLPSKNFFTKKNQK